MLRRTLLVCIFANAAWAAEGTAPYGFGRAPLPKEVAAVDIAIGPQGHELPAGGGDVESGARLYASRCAACHGPNGHEGPDNQLVGGQGSLAGPRPQLTIGSYWPYATTLFDYIRRAMPFPAPGSLADSEVYALSAYLLHLNGIVSADFVANRSSLPQVEMPNRHGFTADPRPEPFRRTSNAPRGE